GRPATSRGEVLRIRGRESAHTLPFRRRLAEAVGRSGAPRRDYCQAGGARHRLRSTTETSNQHEADPFDLLCHLAFNGPLRTRRERADRVKKDEKIFFEKYAPEARAILADLLEKYAEHGTAQFVIPDVLKIPPISDRGNVIEIAKLFGGPDK